MQDAPKVLNLADGRRVQAFAGLPEMPTGVTSAGPPEGQGAEAGLRQGQPGPQGRRPGPRAAPPRHTKAARDAAQAARCALRCKACTAAAAAGTCCSKAACRAPAVSTEGSSLRRRRVSEPRSNVQHLRRQGVKAARRGDCRVRHIDLRLCTGVHHRRASARARRGTGYA